MSINVFRKELRLNRRTFLIWIAAIILYLIVYLLFFPYMQSPVYTELLEGFPDAIMEALNIRNIMFEDTNYYYAGLLMQYLLLLAAIFTAMLAGRLISRDTDLNTADFLYTRPVTRTSIMAAKVAAFLLISISVHQPGLRDHLSRCRPRLRVFPFGRDEQHDRQTGLPEVLKHILLCRL